MNFGKSVRESVELCVKTLEEISTAEKELAAERKAGKIAPADAEAKFAELVRARAYALGTVNTRIERDRLAHHAAVDKWNIADGTKIDEGDLKLRWCRRSNRRLRKAATAAAMKPCWCWTRKCWERSCTV